MPSDHAARPTCDDAAETLQTVRDWVRYAFSRFKAARRWTKRHSSFCTRFNLPIDLLEPRLTLSTSVVATSLTITWASKCIFSRAICSAQCMAGATISSSPTRRMWRGPWPTAFRPSTLPSVRPLAEARDHLQPSGRLVVELGIGRQILEADRPDLPFLCSTWRKATARSLRSARPTRQPPCLQRMACGRVFRCANTRDIVRNGVGRRVCARTSLAHGMAQLRLRGAGTVVPSTWWPARGWLTLAGRR
jgi:hypothetical protein